MGRSKKKLKRNFSGSTDSGHCSKQPSSFASSDTDVSSEEMKESAGEVSVASFYPMITFEQTSYHCWFTYFYDEEYHVNSLTVMKLNTFIEFFLKHPATAFDDEAGLNFDINLCINDDDVSLKWPNFIEDLKTKPEHTLKCIKAAFFEVMMDRAIKADRGNINQIFKILAMNHINILNYESINLPSCLTSSFCDELITTKGKIVGMGGVILKSENRVLVCNKCDHQILLKLQKGRTGPKNCNVCGHRRMRRVLDSPYDTKTILQKIYVKESHDATSSTVSVELKDNLVDKFMIGDEIRVIGIPRIAHENMELKKSKALHIHAECVSKIENSSEIFDDISWSVIEAIKSEADVLSLLVRSLCPGVQGHEIVKAALILSLLGGTQKNDERRDNVHLLIVGNLGLGKSQLLRACAQVAPEATYIRGNSTVSLEPTIRTVKEGTLDNYYLESGVLTNFDLVCLDELDKMSSRHGVLYDAIVRKMIFTGNTEFKSSLPMRATIFAISNPTKKCYEPSKTLAENVNLSKQLLGKFDLIFLMQDHPDAYLDKLMCDRVLREHVVQPGSSQKLKTFTTNATNKSEINHDRTLRERLVTPIESSDLLPEKLFKIYVKYAKSYIKPNLSDASKKTIENLVCKLRCKLGRSIPRFERYVQTLIALTEARAKVDLRLETNEQDVFDASEILEQSMSFETRVFSQNQFQATRKTSNLSAKMMKQFLEDLERETSQTGKSTFTYEELRSIAGQENLTEIVFSTLLSKLNEQGYLLKITSNTYKIIFH